MRKRILITGVHGLVGSLVYRHFSEQGDAYEVFGMDRSAMPSERVAEGGGAEIPAGHFFEGDLSDLAVLESMMSGVDCVIHLAADPNGEAGWESVLPNNIVGTYHVFEAARRAGVARVISASSIHVSNGYRGDEPYRAIVGGEFEGEPAEIPMVSVEEPVRPINFYGVSKLCGEALARMYSEAHGMSCVCLRLGWVLAEDRAPTVGDRAAFCSQRDVVQLIEKCVGAGDDLRFEIFYGLSDNRCRWIDLENAREKVGYEPQDSAENMES